MLRGLVEVVCFVAVDLVLNHHFHEYNGSIGWPGMMDRWRSQATSVHHALKNWFALQLLILF